MQSEDGVREQFAENANCSLDTPELLATLADRADYEREEIPEASRDLVFEQAHDTIMGLTSRVTALEAAARAFLAKLDECSPHITDAFLHRELRCGPYTGPNYAEELAELRRALG